MTLFSNTDFIVLISKLQAYVNAMPSIPVGGSKMTLHQVNYKNNLHIFASLSF